jgi:hypothetical protein
MKNIWTVALTISVAACSTERGVPTTWSELNVGTLRLELEDKQRYELLIFHADGTVSATIGMKTGPLAAPLWYWSIDSNRLIIAESATAGTIQNVLKEPRLEGNRLLVSVSGASKRTYVLRRGAA